MIYLGLLVTLGIWALIAWRDRPVREVARIYFVCCMLTAISEPILIRLVRAYEMHLWLLPDRHADNALTSIVVGLCLDPLLGVVYARHCRRHPVVIALVTAMLLGALEWYMVLSGAIIYLRPWSPLITVGFFFGFFLLIWRVATHPQRIPLWAETYGAAAAWAYGTDLLLQGMLKLWEYDLIWFGDAWEDTRTVSDLLMTFAISPLATVVATAPLRRRWIWVVATGVTLWALEMAAWITGWIAMERPVAAMEIFRRVALVTLATLYARWARATPT